jgi:kynurenine formamidase
MGNWRGWPEIPSPSGAAGTWIELSHPLHADLARISFFPAARFERVMTLATDRVNVTEIQMVCHFGTHIDAPCHFIPGAPSIDEIPLERLHGHGVVLRLRCQPYGLIEASHLAAADPEVERGDIVLLDTGWAQHFGTERYNRHPSLSIDAAEWLVDRGVKLVGLDVMTPDISVDRRHADFNWPVHHVLLSHGVLIAEHLTNLRSLAGARIEAMFLALNIKGADGAPARVIARPLP